MKEYTIVKKKDWDQVPELEINERVSPFDADIRAYAKICYDDENLWVRLRAHEQDILAENTDPMDEPCLDSCLEFFFSPDNASDRYFNVEYNPNCLRFLGIGKEDVRSLIRLYPLHDESFDFEPKVEYIADGWQITYHIPYRFIRLFFPEFKPESGGFIRGNCYTTGESCKVPHNIAWSPVDPDVMCAFHNPRAFGIMRFE